MFVMIKRSALPMVALARHPWPRTLAPQLISRLLRHGPLTTMTGATLPVVVCTPSRLNPGFSTPFTAAMTSEKYAGKQPAITALAAIFSMVATPFNGGITPSATFLSIPAAAIISSTAARVDGKTGRPSLQPRLTSSSNKMAGSFDRRTLEPAASTSHPSRSADSPVG
jgi:hypothetical protein